NQDLDLIAKINEEAHELTESLLNQETGQRGYNLTGDEKFLEPYFFGTDRYSSLAWGLKLNIRRFPSLTDPVNAMIESGFYWHNHYGSQQVIEQGHNMKVTNQSLAKGKESFDEFRSKAKTVYTETSLQREAKIKYISSLTSNYHILLILLSFFLFMTLIVMMLSAFKKVTEPILEVQNAIKEIAGGNFDYPLFDQKKSKDELSELVSSINIMRYQLHQKMNTTMLLAETDSLTGIFNRGFFDKELNKLMVNAHLYGGEFSLILIDIDHFKKFNDSYGHTEGDRALCHVTKLISEQTRYTDVFARYGGEEFAVLVTTPDAASLAEKLRKKIDETLLENYHITASFGISDFQIGEDAKSLINRADQALYEAKRKGRNRVEYVK
ncbi:diguanylate cyclase, partial [Bacillus sp. JJ1764]|uniref:diguanylate cyclase n=1 Tax=Bacillus sp. JJ1764 TaxID=3122964 RepID=UPI002FFEA952